MTVALLITTYNWVEALKKCLDSVLKQTYSLDEIVIADDGSTQSTKALIESYQSLFPCPLIHSWQEDKGFRVARSRNKAIAQLTADYVIMIDGDMVLHKDFIKDHVTFAEKNHFISGRRVKLNEAYTANILSNDTVPHFFSRGVKRARENAIRFPLLAQYRAKASFDCSRVHSCNMSFWRQDLVRVNGYNSAFIGWGSEDRELCERLFFNGIKNKHIKFSLIAYHLYHQESSKAMELANDSLYEKTVKEKLTYCEHGLNEFMDLTHPLD